MPRTLLFVYGTLMRGEHNHAQLAGAQYLGESRTRPEWTLVDCGAYPAIVAGSTSIEGEVWSLDDAHLHRLDDFEGHPHLFRRTRIELAHGQPAETYVYARDRFGAEIPGGSWRRRG